MSSVHWILPSKTRSSGDTGKVSSRLILINFAKIGYFILEILGFFVGN